MSAERVEFHPAAIEEIEGAISWHLERSARASHAFLSEIDLAIVSIQDAPKRWPIFEGECRRIPLIRFPYYIVYREKAGMIQVIAVAHRRRRPGYWSARTL